MASPAVDTGRKARTPSPSKRSAQTIASEHPHPDPNGLTEFSVVYTNRSLNHMSQKFQQVMREISSTLRTVYGADSAALVPGSGTFAMEAVARQFGTNEKCMVLRNGYFSFRWSQIFEAGSIPSSETVLMARPVDNTSTPAYAPHPLKEVLARIRSERPAVVFAPHVETSSGIILPEDYMREVAAAVHEVGGLFVLDCIASGCLWVNMADVGVDVIISAPQKGWSGSPCAGIVVLSTAARAKVESTQSTCFAVDLKKWIGIMEAYEKGGHMYHTTMPTDSIITFRDVQKETERYGFQRAKQEQLDLGAAVRQALKRRGFKSVAAEGFEAPGVVVSYTADVGIKNGTKFATQGMQIAAGVPLMVDEFTQSADFLTFRLGLFGLDKIHHIPETVQILEQALDRIEDATRKEGELASRL